MMRDGLIPGAGSNPDGLRNNQHRADKSPAHGTQAADDDDHE
jgi:hypothetical protein